MKKYIFFIIAVVVLLFAIAGSFYLKAFFANREPATEQNVPVKEQEASADETDIIEISVDSVRGITQQEAENLCYFALGEKDEETGFTFSFGVSGAVEKDKKQYYVIRASWLVNNSHMSYIGDFFVSADGKEIYDGIANQGEYTMEKVIWRK